MKFRTFLTTSLLAVSAVALVGCDDDDDDPNGPDDDVETFTANLTGAKERPTPVTTNATGVANFTATTVGNTTTITYTVTVTGDLSGPVTAAHIHGPADENGVADPIVTLTVSNTTATAGVLVSGSFTSTGHPTINMAQLLAQMENGNTYVNLHTAANGAGEIRGQIDD